RWCAGGRQFLRQIHGGCLWSCAGDLKMSKRRDRKRRIRKTVLAVGEGHTEIGFLKYLRSLYCSTQNRSTIAPKVIIKNAYGKGPEHIYSTALAERQNKSFDRAFVLLDTDVEWP